MLGGLRAAGRGEALIGERDRWMQALQARLQRVSTTQDLSPVLEKEASAEARQLARTLTDNLDSLPAMHRLGWLHWYRYQALPEGHDQQDLQAAFTMFTSCFINGMTDLPSPLLPQLAEQATPTALRLLEMAQRSVDQELLSATSSLWRRILAATPSDHPSRAAILSNFGIALLTRFQSTGAQADLDAAIQAGQQAVQATPADHPDRAGYLSNLGTALGTRFESTGAQADLDAAIQALQQAVQATPTDHPDRAGYLSNLGAALRIQSRRTGAQADLDAAIQALQQAVRATDHPDHAGSLSNFGTALLTRFGRTGAQADLDAAIQALQQAVQATPTDHPDHAGRLSNLGTALQDRFGRTGAQADLDAAIQALQQAVQATPTDHPNRAAILSNLGTALRDRFGRTGAQADLDAAIQALQQAVQATPTDHPNRAMYLSNLGTTLGIRFERTGKQADHDMAIQAMQALQQAVQATPTDHPDYAMYLSNFGITLRNRFERTGAQADLDAAIQALQQAVQATPADHPDRAMYLSNLGTALGTRFERTGAQADLDAALQAEQQTVQATPADHPNRAMYLSNLGITLRNRFERTGAQADLDASIQAGQQAVRATPADHPNRAMYLSNLGTALRDRSWGTGAQADLDASIQAGQQAVQATPADHPNRAAYLSNLGNALRNRFERTGAQADLDASIQAGQQAVQATPANQPNRATYLSNLGDALRTRFERTGEAGDRDAAFRMYNEAASVEVAPPSVRIGAGRAGALLVADADPGRAAGLLEAAVLLLPTVAPRFLERGDQQYAIGRFAGLAADAAALALSDPAVPEPQRPARALRLLEAARAMLLSQALSTRSDLSELHERHPELAARFTELRDWLDRPPPAAGPDLGNLPGDDALQRPIRDRRKADAEFTQLLDRIRSMEGFATFGLPPSAEQLEAQAQQGPVVVLNVSSYRSDAILLTSGGITSQILPGLDQATVTSQVQAFHQALDTIVTSESPVARVRAQEAIQQVLAWLWDNAAGPVLHALGHRDQPTLGEPWPRLWWVAGGLLALLPVHAAGHHTSPPDPGHRTVMDRVVSSYTPIVGALAHARTARPATTPGTTIRSLIVAMPTTPDLPGRAELAYVPDETALLQRCLPNPTVLSESLTTSDTADRQLPTKAAVLKHLPGCAIAHFACHGSTDPADPSQSRLLLHDHHRDPLTVAALAPLALDHAHLAYLSACSTASVTNARLLDEAIHLATAFQLAGFPHVIGTLWEINDAIAVEIASTFYTALANPDGTLDPHHAARALHQATRAQRDRRPATPYLWASHIHAGT